MAAERPLVIVGKGAAYSRAENSIRNLIDITNMPFIATPMGKGVVQDTASQCVQPARTLALQKADVVLLLGARLNWILHFGRSPRYDPNVKVIQIDLCPEELHNSILSTLAVQSDVKAFVETLGFELANQNYRFNTIRPWWRELNEKTDKNKKIVAEMAKSTSLPLNYYAVFENLQSVIPKDAIIVSEGANTMDIGRTMLNNILPRHRLDAG